MKKLLIFYLFVMLFVSGLAYGSYFEVKGGYFSPSEQVFKDVYGNGITFGGEVGFTVFSGFSIWAGGEYFSKIGKLTFSKEDTEIQIIPLYAGIKVQLSSPKISPYMGVGFGYFIFKETSAIGTVDDGKIGFVGQIGCHFKFGGGVFIDLQGSYKNCKVNPTGLESNLGGFYAMLGIGYTF